MTSAELREVLDLDEFRKELDELSAYLASIMQERPIVHLIAKYLWRRKRTFALEVDRCDLVVDNTRIEFKFNFNRCEETLTKELQKYRNDLKQLKALSKSKWGVAARIIRDVCDDDKRPDIFVWIVCSRDLTAVSETDRKHIAVGTEQCKYNACRPYNSDGESLVVIDQFLELLRVDRSFSLSKFDIPTRGDFASTYHFRICDFSTSASAGQLSTGEP